MTGFTFTPVEGHGPQDERDAFLSARDRAVSSIEQKTFAKGLKWVTIFRNDAIADQARRTLYLFYALDGHYLASNFTGK